MTNLELIKKNYLDLKNKVSQACQKAGRSTDSVQTLFATKTIDPDRIKEVISLGAHLFGENRAQELKSKYDHLPQSVDWHFIGHLQTNKVKDVIPACSTIHSLDRLSLAREINKQAQKNNCRPRVFIEVNTSGEETKSGLPPKDVLPFCKQLHEFSHIDVCGLMTIATNTNNTEIIRDCFRKTKELRTELNDSLPDLNISELSMGMSNDFELAIAEGSTLIRLGSALFGARSAQ